MTSKKSLAILSRKGQYVAGVFTPKGLFATCLPHTSRKEAIEAVQGIGLPQDSDPKHLAILEMVFHIVEGNPNIDISGIPLDFSDLTEKQVQILRALMRIPRGKTVTYGELARMAGMPRAARFVGNVMARNRFAPILPCHRVVAKNGLGGYGLGRDRKRLLLKKEGAFDE